MLSKIILSLINRQKKRVMIRSIAKHKYLKGRSASSKARKHVNYIAFRSESRDEKERGSRKFFDGNREQIEPTEVKDLIFEQGKEKDFIMHKLILSPGIESVDMKEYTREVMEKFAEHKRLDLEWRAVIHKNTDHQHAHIVIMGKDKRGYDVMIRKEDHQYLRKVGDDYLEREHKLDRFLDREIPTLLKTKEYERSGDDYFKSLFSGKNELKDKDKRREKDLDPDRDRREFEKLDKDIRDALKSDDRKVVDFGKGKKQWIREEQGRWSDFHSHAQTMKIQMEYDNLLRTDPELAESMLAELKWAKHVERELSNDQNPRLKQILGFEPQLNREVEKSQEQQRMQEFTQTAQVFEANRQIQEGQKLGGIEQAEQPKVKDRDELERDK